MNEIAVESGEKNVVMGWSLDGVILSPFSLTIVLILPLMVKIKA